MNDAQLVMQPDALPTRKALAGIVASVLVVVGVWFLQASDRAPPPVEQAALQGLITMAFVYRTRDRANI